MEALRTLRSKLEEYGLSQDVTRLEVADTEQLAFLYQDRISVLLGTLNDLDYKLDRARYVLTNADGKGCGPTDTGRWISAIPAPAAHARSILHRASPPCLPAMWCRPRSRNPPRPRTRPTAPTVQKARILPTPPNRRLKRTPSSCP